MVNWFPNILLVEDNPDHAEMTRMALMNGNVENTVYTVTNGEEALNYLYRHGDYSDHAKSPVPSLILLDIKLPRMDGFEVLRRIKEDPDLKSIPVILLTTSNAQNEINRGYEKGANSYVTKPLVFDEFVVRLKGLYSYWIHTNTLPMIG